MKFRYKLFSYFSCVILIPLIITVAISIFYLKKNIDYEINDRLIDCISGIENKFNYMRAEMLEKITQINIAAELSEYYQTFDRGKFVDLLKIYQTIGNYDVFEIGDFNGKVMARGHNPELWGEDKSNNFIIKESLKGNIMVDFDYGKSGFAIRAVKPLFSEKQEIMGTLMIGYSLNENMAHSYKIMTGNEIIFYFKNNNAVISTSPELNQTINFQELAESVLEDKIIFFDLTIAGNKYRALGKGIYQNDGALLGLLIAVKNLKEFNKINNHTLIMLFFNGIIGIAITSVLLFIISRRFSKPIEKLRENMDLISKGYFNTRIPTEYSIDEFGELQKNFNEMAQALETLNIKLRETQKELVQNEKLAVAGSIAAELAHEIRNPLNSMSANIELLKSDFFNKKFEKTDNRIKILNDEILRLNNLITNFLHTTAPVNLKLSKSDIIKTLRQSIDLFDFQNIYKNINFAFSYPDNVVIVPHDIELLRRVFINIIKNAVEAVTGAGEIKIIIKEYEDTVEILFKDNGCGMTIEEQKRVFDRFFTTKDSGVGIGLSYVLKIIVAHNGKIFIDSMKNHGTEIRVVLIK